MGCRSQFQGRRADYARLRRVPEALPAGPPVAGFVSPQRNFFEKKEQVRLVTDKDVRRRVSKATSRGLDGARVRDCGSPFPSNGGQRRVGSDEPTTVSPLHLKSN